MFLQNNEMKEIYGKYRNSDIKYTRISLTKWFFNEEENAVFCLLELGSNPSSHDGRTIFMLRVKNQHIIFDLDKYNTVIFLNDSPLLKNNLYQVKYLITSAFSVVGRWGDGDTENVYAVPDPTFEFLPQTGD